MECASTHKKMVGRRCTCLNRVHKLKAVKHEDCWKQDVQLDSTRFTTYVVITMKSPQNMKKYDVKNETNEKKEKHEKMKIKRKNEKMEKKKNVKHEKKWKYGKFLKKTHK